MSALSPKVGIPLYDGVDAPPTPSSAKVEVLSTT